jgi:hypothetical protein
VRVLRTVLVPPQDGFAGLVPGRPVAAGAVVAVKVEVPVRELHAVDEQVLMGVVWEVVLTAGDPGTLAAPRATDVVVCVGLASTCPAEGSGVDPHARLVSLGALELELKQKVAGSVETLHEGTLVTLAVAVIPAVGTLEVQDLIREKGLGTKLLEHEVPRGSGTRRVGAGQGVRRLCRHDEHERRGHDKLPR